MKKLYLLGIFLIFSLVVFATHNRAGEIIYRHHGDSTPTYSITIITYTEANSLADRDSLELKIWECGGAQPLATFYVKRDSFQNFIGNIRKNYYTLDAYTFPGPQCYRITMLDPNRIDGIINIGGSVNVPFYIEDTLNILDPQFYGYNSSPVLLQPPIDFAARQQIFIHNPAAYDPDGDSLTFELIPPKQNPNTDVPGYKYPDDPSFATGTPNIFEIDQFNGELTWNVPYTLGIYNVAILVREYREKKLIGTLIRDMQIIVVDNFNNPPVISEANDTCIIAGERLQLWVTGTDLDAGQILTLTANGGPFFVANPATFTTTPSTSPTVGFFDWKTQCNHIRPGVYSVVFKVADNFSLPNNNSQPYVDVETWTIRVVAPPPENLIAVSTGNSVILSWDSLYTCAGFENFRGFTVWRKRGCDSLEIDTCQAGGLSSMGYVKISGNKPISKYSFTDNNVSSALVNSYRVLAEFAQAVPPPSTFTYNEVSSLPSNEVCVEFKVDVPVITHVDVVLTDPTIGIMDVRWVKPQADVLDTILNQGPYKYELFRDRGFAPGGSAVLIQTFVAATYSQLNFSNYIDTGLNTLDSAYNYQIVFYASAPGGSFYEIGKSDPASSVYLQIASGSNQLTLTWSEIVPWLNYEYFVLKENPIFSGQFDTIAKTTTQNYVDLGLKNGDQYCYKIRSYGSYFNPLIPAPLINHSEIKCSIPMDTIPPCAPKLEVSNDCELSVVNLDPEDLKNVLTWNNPNNICADDVVGYKVYYSAISGSAFTLLATLGSPLDTTFVHGNLTSLAGCYAVTAIDSFSNESLISNIVCMDNCPVYKLPNVFTPNGDGQNDYYTPFMPYLFIDHIDIKIFSRWGNLVFESTDPDIMWDGTDQKTGKPVSEGVYYYVCDVFEVRVSGITEIDKPLSGYIHLIRGNGKTN